MIDDYQDLLEPLERVFTRAAEGSNLTLEDVEKALALVDPDGRRFQEVRLLSACKRLEKSDVETVIRLAEYLGKREFPPPPAVVLDGEEGKA